MKKIFFITLVTACLLLSAGCNNQQVQGQPEIVRDTKAKITDNYLGSEFKGNFIWGGAMNLAWNELNENILKEKLKLDTDDEVALRMAEILNNPVFTKNDLDEKSYYVKSGYGQETVDIINRESRKKFPSKSFADLKLDLSPADIISYAYFLKEVEYQTEFEKKDVSFEGENVKGFYAKVKGELDNLKILKYESDDKFIVSLQLRDESDQLILAKGYDMEKPQNVVDEINGNGGSDFIKIGEHDRFEAPKLHLDYHRDYVELIGRYLANKGFESYFIGQMFENIKFDMDEKGARVENEAVIVLPKSVSIDKDKPKNLILDKPYWVVMKRKDSKNPYFILGVKNTELMEKVK
ncbi:MAG: hypothetical protein GX452_05630 [Ignavibacteriales bacterium]|jgi:hypothetical protein|nr:hypothetical protein [Ignavibacteriales bacterium]HPO55998.1 hypothetical protein [Ignavibacteriaceae bacterium]